MKDNEELVIFLVILACILALGIRAYHYERTHSCTVWSMDGLRSTTAGPDVCMRLEK